MAATKWILDPVHSELQFKVKHLMISTITGDLKTFTAELTAENDEFENAKILFKGDINSLDTGNTDRDHHLKSEDFFNAAKFAHIEFESSSMKKEANDYLINGNLTIKGKNRPVTLTAEFGGIAIDPWGNTKAGFTLKGKINRTDFGLIWNTSLEGGGVMVSEEVQLLGELQFIKQASSNIKK